MSYPKCAPGPSHPPSEVQGLHDFSPRRQLPLLAVTMVVAVVLVAVGVEEMGVVVAVALLNELS